jgi:hypothetical protein
VKGLVTEAQLEEAVNKWAKARGVICLKLNLVGNTGWPDRLYLGPGGTHALIEYKRPGRGKVLERNQPDRHERLARIKQPVGVFDDYDEAITFLESSLLSKRGS